MARPLYNIDWSRWLPEALRHRLLGRPELQRLIGNTGWLLVDRIFGLGLGVVMGIVVARYLGPAQYGVYSYALAFVALFATLATLGIDGLLTRELVRHPQDVGETLGTVFSLKLASTLFAIAIIAASAAWFSTDDETSAWIILLVGASLVFKPADVIEVWFQAQLRVRAVVIARNLTLVAMSMLRLLLILAGAPLITFVWVGFAEAGLLAAGVFLTYLLQRQTLATWRFSFARARRLLRECWPLVLAGLSVTIYMRIDQVMLGELLDKTAVGIYSVAARISEMSYFIPMALMASFAPAIIAEKERSVEGYHRRLQSVFNLMALIALGFALALTVLAIPLVDLLFGPMYRDAGLILAVHVWATPFVFLGTAQSTWDIAEGLTIYGLVRTTVGAVINIALNMWLIPQHGGLGAAAATLVSYACSAWLLNLLSHKTRPIFWRQLRALLLVDLILSMRELIAKRPSPEQ